MLPPRPPRGEEGDGKAAAAAGDAWVSHLEDLTDSLALRLPAVMVEVSKRNGPAGGLLQSLSGPRSRFIRPTGDGGGGGGGSAAARAGKVTMVVAACVRPASRCGCDPAAAVVGHGVRFVAACSAARRHPPPMQARSRCDAAGPRLRAMPFTGWRWRGEAGRSS